MYPETVMSGTPVDGAADVAGLDVGFDAGFDSAGFSSVSGSG
jgi:hypothetical protein